MRPTSIEIARLSGILDGEGSFYIKKGSPCIALQMSDRDIVEWAAQLTGVQLGQFTRQPKGKATFLPISHCRIHGTRAIEWMLTLYTLMGARRKQKIREIVGAWRASKAAPRASRGTRFMATCHPTRPRVGGGLCKACYMRKWRKRPSQEQRMLEMSP